MKKNNIKKFFVWFKNAWNDPRKKAGIKLMFYFLFFIIFLSVAAITNSMKNIDKAVKEENKTVQSDKDTKYIDKQKYILNNKISINSIMNINNNKYVINGNIENNVLEGYLESYDVIKKIIINENGIYENKDGEYILYSCDINKDLFNFKNIFNIINRSNVIMNNEGDNKIYSYDILNDNNNIIIKVYTNSLNIYKIEYNDNGNQYIISFDI